MPRYIYSVTVRWNNSHAGPQKETERLEANSTLAAINSQLRAMLKRRSSKNEQRDCRAIRAHVTVEALRVGRVGEHPDSFVREDA